MKCKYGLIDYDFDTLHHFIVTFSDYFEVEFEKYTDMVKERVPDFKPEDFLIFTEFGDTIQKVIRKIKSHMKECDQCGRSYRKYVEQSRRDHSHFKRILRQAYPGTDVDRLDFIEPDFLGLYING
jgi:hypothetical protein